MTLQQALAGLAAQAPTEKPDKPMLLKLAEHVAIRFALDSYERGELRVNAVKQLLDRMNTEIEALRKILTTQEEQMAAAQILAALDRGTIDRLIAQLIEMPTDRALAMVRRTIAEARKRAPSVAHRAVNAAFREVEEETNGGAS